jgi:hypothetical protein
MCGTILHLNLFDILPTISEFFSTFSLTRPNVGAMSWLLFWHLTSGQAPKDRLRRGGVFLTSLGQRAIAGDGRQLDKDSRRVP